MALKKPETPAEPAAEKPAAAPATESTAAAPAPAEAAPAPAAAPAEPAPAPVAEPAPAPVAKEKPAAKPETKAEAPASPRTGPEAADSLADTHGAYIWVTNLRKTSFLQSSTGWWISGGERRELMNDGYVRNQVRSGLFAID